MSFPRIWQFTYFKETHLVLTLLTTAQSHTQSAVTALIHLHSETEYLVYELRDLWLTSLGHVSLLEDVSDPPQTQNW